mmetsp:Transcript_4388/g.7682  ORF Transcript_4388/g.7682 Transcript_4388/m.7682 type:complete len:304 (+) Transcript_4388:156-1067(+)
MSFPGHVGRHRRSSTAAALASMFLLLSLQTQIQSADGFSTTRSAIISDKTRYSLQTLLPLNSEVQTFNSIDASAEDDDDDAVNGLPKLTGCLKDRTVHEFKLKEHKPLGCSVEESLADEPDGAKYVFVAEVHKGGNAEKAGLRIGDVIVQLSGTVDEEVVDVAGLGIEKIRSLVGGRSDESPLVIRIARGSDVMERHLLALVELCIIGDDASTADYITSIYAEEDIIDIAGDSETAMCEEDDTDSILDSMWGDWSSEEEKEEEVVEEVKEEKKKKVAPWSSRSSGSGTYVRNPKTGKMENIDE